MQKPGDKSFQLAVEEPVTSDFCALTSEHYDVWPRNWSVNVWVGRGNLKGNNPPAFSKWNLRRKNNSEWAVFDSRNKWKNIWIPKAWWTARQASLSTSYISAFLFKQMITAVNDNSRSQHTKCLKESLKNPWNRDPTLLIAPWLNPRVWFCFLNIVFLAV